MMGLQVAIPYDIANIWNRPVSLAPALSTLCGLALLYILFFGVISAPFGYMFGVPSQKYVIGSNGTDSFLTMMLQVAEQMHSDAQASADDNGDSRSFEKSAIRRLLQYSWDYPDFSESAFKFMPESVTDPACQQLILCQAHSALRSLPDVAIPAFRIFSKKLTNITEHQRTSIMKGLACGSCEDSFADCPSDLHSILLMSLLDKLPELFRRSLKMPHFSFSS